MGSEEQQRDALIEKVVARLEGKKVRVTYKASETVYYETVIEANTREEADEIYYDSGVQDLAPVCSDYFETYDIYEEDI
jgi:hypothetical protein